MRLKGLPSLTRNEKIVPIVRLGSTTYFIARAMENFELFDTLVAKPVPTLMGGEVGKPKEAIPDKAYFEKLGDYNAKFTDFMVINSLAEVAYDQETTVASPVEGVEPTVIKQRVSEPLVFDTVEKDKPETWANWEKELREFGLSEGELNRVRMCVVEANSLSDDAVKEALNDFLRRPPVPAHRA